MIAAFVLDAIVLDVINAAFQKALSNDIVIEHTKLWSGVHAPFEDDSISYELRVISLAPGTSVKCYSPKSFSFFKASLEVPFSGILHAHMLQSVLETSFQPNTCIFFLGLLICQTYCPFKTCRI